jgi:hypothetical protein
MDIGGWLRSLGLGEYEATFRENKIDETVLPKLTADDLKELGVRALGDRRKLLDAIAGLDAYAHLSLAAVATAAVPPDTAERRSDLVGSTALLQGVAEPNTVLIAESTRRLIGNLFDLEDLGAKDLKGIAGPVRAWTVLRPSGVESRFEALHASGLTELVGREEELELLLRRWSRAKTGEGQVVLLSGEAGIGKSRLTAALLERLATEPTRGYAIFVRRSTPIAPCIRSSVRPRPLSRIRHYSPSCCHSRTMGVIRRSTWTHNSAGSKRWKRSPRRWGLIAAKPLADDLRGCALD